MNHAMKRIAALFAVAVMLLSLLGCEASPAPAHPDAQLPVEQETPMQETPAGEDAAPEQQPAEEKPAETPEVSDAPSVQMPVIEELREAADYDEIFELFTAVQENANLIFSMTENDPIMGTPMSNPEAERYGDPLYPVQERENVLRGALSAADGSRIYMISTGELVIMEADGENTSELGRAFVTSPAPDGYNGGELPQAVYVSGDCVTVITYESLYRNYEKDGEVDYDSAERVHVKRYDVSDPAAPVIISDFAQSGRYLDSYLSDGNVYVISAHSVWQPDAEDPATFVPVLTENGEDRTMEASSVILCPKLDSTDYTVVSAVDTADGTLLSSKAVTGYHTWNDADGSGLYLGGSSYYFEISEPYEEAQYSVSDYAFNTYTRLIRMEMDGTLSVTADAMLDGHLFDDDAITLTNEGISLATLCSTYSYQVFTDPAYGFVNEVLGERTSQLDLCVLDLSLESQKRVEAVSAPEDVYKFRFDGSKVYVTVHEDMIPDYSLDLSVAEASAEPLDGLTSYGHHLYALEEGITLGLRVSEEEKLILGAYGADLALLAEIEVSENWDQAMNAPESVKIFREEQIVAIPVGTAYSMYLWENGEFTALGDAVLGYVSADTGAFRIGDYWYFCNDAAVVVLDEQLEPVMKSEFAYG
ncbi:MAG: beta-propeller domain-containing protein [Oscillospiraceae bacterium]|nr:beta-propeller domain-containing protein [Oscillospiraceae bacterium]